MITRSWLKPLGGGVNTIIIKYVLFLHKGLNAEKIVVKCDITSLNYALFALLNRLTIQRLTKAIPACYASCTIYCASRGGLDKVYIKADMGKRRKTLKIWLKRTWDRGVVKGTRLEAKDTKNIRCQRQPFRGQTFSRARTQAQVFSKKDSNNTVFKIFFHAF